jgi:pullulanase
MQFSMKPLIIFSILLAGALLFFVSRIFAQGKVGTPAVGQSSLAWNPYPGYPVYQGNDLGVTYDPSASVLKIWSPPAQAMKLRLYRNSTGGDPMEEINCRQEPGGVWSATLKGDRKNLYYTFQARIDGKWRTENPDPYARAVGVNGLRGQIIDLRETDPPGWDTDRSPELKNLTDVILYELHVRDFSIAPGSGIKNKGRFPAFTEQGTVNGHGQSTGIDHLAEMGITHVHLLPVFDFTTVDESKPEIPQYNWGYDPQNYNTPEGSYSTDPEDGKVRITEFKKMVQSLHKKGLGVVMDVVYNHTGRTHDSNLDQLVPGYYYRQWEKDNSYSNASGCGNETASDRTMVRKLIVESVVFWVNEYHVDGFRFDLMAIHDMETMNQVSEALHAIDPSIIIYGEGWTAGDSPLPEKYRSLKRNVNQLKGIAVFSDDIRDAIKGSVFDDHSTGFASGSPNMVESLKTGIVACGDHPQVDYSKANYSKDPYAANPLQVINYVSCHDNHTLYDKLKVSRPDATEAEILRMHKLANTIVLTSQGIPFLHAGVEMKRTKGGEHNSYNKADSVNRINWDWKYENREMVEFYRQMIALRKAHPAFRMAKGEMVRANLEFLPADDPHIVAFQLKDHANNDPWKEITVVFNGSGQEKSFEVPAGPWNVALQDHQFVEELPVISGKVQLAPYSALIIYRE